MVYLSIFGIVISFILFFFNKGYESANRFLSIFFLSCSVYILSLYYTFFSDSVFLAACFAYSVVPVFMFGIPCLYFYFRSILTDDARLKKRDYLHFFTFSLYLLGMLPYYASPWQQKMDMARHLLSNDWDILTVKIIWFVPNWVTYILRWVQLWVYVLLQWRMLASYLFFNKKATPAKQQKVVIKWLLVLNVSFTLLAILLSAVIVQLFSHPQRSAALGSVYLVFILLQVSLVLFMAGLLLFPQVLYGLPQLKTPVSIPLHEPLAVPDIRGVEPVVIVEPDLSVGSPKEAEGTNIEATYSPPEEEAADKSPLIEEGVMKNLALVMDAYMAASKPYLDKNFSLPVLSVALGVPVHHLRYYFGQHLGISFSTYKNKARVGYAKELIMEGNIESLSIEGIGQMAGFSSKSNFFAAFKTEMGCSPLEYMKSLQQGSLAMKG